MLDKLAAVESKYMELESLISDPSIIEDQPRWQRYNKEHAELSPIVEKYREYRTVKEGIADAEHILADESDEELKALAQEELKELKERLLSLEEELPILLLPKDPNDEKNVIVEIRGGVGGEEAALFAGDLLRMYGYYAESQGWKLEILSESPTEIGGYKEVSFSISGYGAYSRLKYESGTHRVQRVPETESSGRIHTSAVTVAVLPEVEEAEIELDMKDVRVDTYRASGAGGQHINKTESAIRLTYLPTGLVVTCQDEKSQRKNLDKALRVLRARLQYDAEQAAHEGQNADRKSQVGSGDRSERIRTYNFPQGRVTDHRIGLTLHKLTSVLDGDLDEIITALLTADRAEKLKEAGNV